MNTSIKINHQDLPALLAKIGEALGKGEDLTIQESSYTNSRYLYTKIGEEKIVLLGKEGEESLGIEKTNPGDLMFSEDEISLMEETKTCPETEDQVDQYYCNHLCSLRESCMA